MAVLLLSAPGGADVKKLTESDRDILDNPISYPGGAPARIAGFDVTLKPGECNGWHRHPVPTFGYMLSGTLTVRYDGGETRVIRAKEAIIEAQHTSHEGCNTGADDVRIIVFYAGAEGVPNTVRDPTGAESPE
jgi:quercetin dioxygenase-like cupin family protein